VSLVVVNLVKLAQVRYVIGVSVAGAGVTKGLLAAIPAAAAGGLVQALVEPWWIAVPLGGVAVLAVYLAALLAFGLSDDDRITLAALVRHRAVAPT
jgi:hypothetical protein